MELDDRKIMILNAIIKSYMQSGEPIGSRTISKLPGLNLSSATIRNEMSDLEEMGYILQPHTSAGRIPSDKGYRFYVDEILQTKQNEVSDFKELMIKRVDRLELVLKQMVRLLASNTNYAAMISGPNYHKTKIKLIQLSHMEEHKLLVVTVVEGNIINNKIIDITETLSDQEMLDLNILLNTSLNGLTVDDINLGIIQKLKKEAGEHREVVDLVLNEVFDAIKNDDEDLQVYTSGATNIFKYPELSDGEKASQLLSAFEEKDKLKEILKNVNEEDNSIKVYIGNESPIQDMQDCSMVTANYELGDGIRGTIGIVGPKRMNYEKVLGMLKNMMTQLDETFKHNT